MSTGQQQSLVTRVDAFIRDEGLFRREQTLLLAVSGGLDSVVLCELMHRLGRNFQVAHVNFQLRGEESTRDEQFVRSLGERYQVPVHVHLADATRYAMDNRLSIQEAARVIRYAWFRELIGMLDAGFGMIQEKKDHLDREQRTRKPGFRLLTAHHLDDNIETVLMNFFKGTGVSGLRGMLPATESVARPLLFARKSELESFAVQNGLQWVEDSSNRESKYSRNFLRHHIIPEIEKLYPQLSANLESHISRFRSVEKFMDASIAHKLQKWLVQKDGEVLAPVNRLRQEPGVETILFELVSRYGFSSAQVPEVKHLLETDTGRQVTSATHRIFRNRAWLIIAPYQTDTAQSILVESLPASFRVGNGFVEIDHMTRPPTDAELKLPDIHYLDARNIDLPLLARRWKKGDYFYPLGMQKKKKLARFFIDAKLSPTQKEKQWVIESSDRILLLPGQRIDNRFRVLPSTKDVIRVWFRAG
jgi:tRNA(Ile)-lysidine synthase